MGDSEVDDFEASRAIRPTILSDIVRRYTPDEGDRV